MRVKKTKQFTTLEKSPDLTTRVGVRLTNEQKDLIAKKAAKYSKSNLSDWMRYAALHFEPPMTE